MAARGFLPGGLSDAGLRARVQYMRRAGIRNPTPERTFVPGAIGLILAISRGFPSTQATNRLPVSSCLAEIGKSRAVSEGGERGQPPNLAAVFEGQDNFTTPALSPRGFGLKRSGYSLMSASRACSRSRERRASTPALAATIVTTRAACTCAASRCGSRLSGGQDR